MTPSMSNRHQLKLTLGYACKIQIGYWMETVFRSLVWSLIVCPHGRLEYVQASWSTPSQGSSSPTGVTQTASWVSSPKVGSREGATDDNSAF